MNIDRKKLPYWLIERRRHAEIRKSIPKSPRRRMRSPLEALRFVAELSGKSWLCDPGVILCHNTELLVSELPADKLTETAEAEVAKFAQLVGGITASFRRPDSGKVLVVVADSRWAMEEFRRSWDNLRAGNA